MPFIIQYLIKLSVSLSVVYLFYRFILRPLTFYNWNRWFLVCYSAIAFVIPFVDISPMLFKAEIAEAEVISYIPMIDPRMLSNKAWLNLDNKWNWILLFFLVGVLIMLVRLTIQFYSYMRLRRSSKLLAESPVKLYQVDLDIIPFSFGNSIFINQEQHDEAELKEIIHHEFIHVKQKHTADMIWAEVLCILNWYNPFAWLIKKVICQNLEFIADQQVLQNGLDKKQYQYLLLKVAGGASFRIANQFNFSFLKKRIVMMNKMNSAKVHLLKFAFVLPLLAILLLSFREKIELILVDEPKQVVELQPEELKIDTLKIVAGKKDEARTTATLTVRFDTVPKKKMDTVMIISEPGKPALNGKVSGVIIRGAGDDKNPPMYIIDEIEATKEQLDNLDPNSIDRVEVLKDRSADQYGEKGKNGVVRIYTKSDLALRKSTGVGQATKERVTIQLRQDNTTITADTIQTGSGKVYSIRTDTLRVDASQRKNESNPLNIRIRGANHTGLEPMYILDGVPVGKGESGLSGINPNDIESLTVLKDASAISLYGKDAQNGVILIVTKKGSKGDKGEKGGKIEKIEKSEKGEKNEKGAKGGK